MDVPAAELLGGHDLARGGLHERRSGEEDRALLADDHGLVAHRRHVGAAGGARAHHARDLRDRALRHRRLVVEDPPEVVAVGEDLVLQRQERAARVDEIDARKVVLQRDLLCPQVLLHRHRVVRAALDRRVVRHHHDLAAVHDGDAADDARAGCVAPVQLLRGQRGELEEGGTGVAQPLDAVSHEQLAARDVPVARAFPASLAHTRETPFDVVDQLQVAVAIAHAGSPSGATTVTSGWPRVTAAPGRSSRPLTVPA